MKNTSQLIDLAFDEDVAGGDVTTLATIDTNHRSSGVIVAKQTGVICGCGIADSIFDKAGPGIRCDWMVRDGDTVGASAEIVRFTGPSRALLTAERIVLNFMQRLSGIASLTRQYVNAVQGTVATILDTRKTTPALRMLEKYAVRCGGGQNHRIGLFDMFLIKENHIQAAGGIPQAIKRAMAFNRTFAKPLKIEVETRTLDDVQSCLDYPVSRIMLDNMDLATMTRAVALINRKIETEASGGVTLQTVRSIAETGIDYISVGALTHSAPALDLSLLLTADA